jgi:hypothetical protein
VSWQLPGIGQIQRTTAVAALVTAITLLFVRQTASALGCLLGAAVMMGNLYALSVIGRSVLAAAQATGGATALGIAVVPLKMLLLIAVVYAMIVSGRVNLAGFVLGSLTQFAAVFIETWRISRQHN